MAFGKETSAETKMCDYILTGIKEGIKRAAEKEYDKAKKQMIKNLDREKGKIIAGIIINIMKTTDFQDFRDRIIFTIRREEN